MLGIIYVDFAGKDCAETREFNGNVCKIGKYKNGQMGKWASILTFKLPICPFTHLPIYIFVNVTDQAFDGYDHYPD